MRIAYVGDFINQGKFLQTSGTSIVILMSLLEDLTSIDVFCPKLNKEIENFELPTKVKLFEFYKYNHPLSILKLLKVPWNSYDAAIFNMLPTGFGKSSTANAAGLMVPILLVKFFRQNNIKVIYHNSVFTNDVKNLGYNSPIDKVRSFFLGIVEKSLFKNVNTFVLLDLYKQRIDKSIGKNLVRVLKARYLEAITTLYINKAMDFEPLDVKKTEIPTVLMHGAWGPQKNIELGLSTLKKLKGEGIKFRLVISGGVNHHFPEYNIRFQELLHAYSDVIDEYLGSVTEKDIMNIFLDASLLILPYNTPGGHSGVLEQAIFFEAPTIAIDFLEFREQTEGIGFVRLINSGDSLELIAKEFLSGSTIKNTEINVKEKIQQAVNNIQKLVK